MLLLLRGVLSIQFGICAFAGPGLVTLVMRVAAYAFVDGIFDVVHAVSHRKEIDHWVLLLIEGLFGIAFGVLAFQAPEVTTVVPHGASSVSSTTRDLQQESSVEPPTR